MAVVAIMVAVVVVIFFVVVVVVVTATKSNFGVMRKCTREAAAGESNNALALSGGPPAWCRRPLSRQAP